jgi:hypothetical protein
MTSEVVAVDGDVGVPASRCATATAITGVTSRPSGSTPEVDAPTSRSGRSCRADKRRSDVA